MSLDRSPTGEELNGDLWSSPLMHYTSPFDDFKELFEDIDENVFQFPETPKSSKTRSKFSKTKN